MCVILSTVYVEVLRLLTIGQSSVDVKLVVQMLSTVDVEYCS